MFGMFSGASSFSYTELCWNVQNVQDNSFTPPIYDETEWPCNQAKCPANSIQNGDSCCPDSCGTCGGSGCGGRPGGKSNCCVYFILASGISCVITQTAPCILPLEPGTCPANSIQNGDYCCPESCGKCGGSGCSGRHGGKSNCCTSAIRANGISCADTPRAPCKW